jgi:hypothetical protein
MTSTFPNDLEQGISLLSRFLFLAWKMRERLLRQVIPKVWCCEIL